MSGKEKEKTIIISNAKSLLSICTLRAQNEFKSSWRIEAIHSLFHKGVELYIDTDFQKAFNQLAPQLKASQDAALSLKLSSVFSELFFFLSVLVSFPLIDGIGSMGADLVVPYVLLLLAESKSLSISSVSAIVFDNKGQAPASQGEHALRADSESDSESYSYSSAFLPLVALFKLGMSCSLTQNMTAGLRVVLAKAVAQSGGTLSCSDIITRELCLRALERREIR